MMSGAQLCLFSDDDFHTVVTKSFDEALWSLGIGDDDIDVADCCETDEEVATHL